ncbi:MAG: ABC transporter permease [Bacillaceae bacterium]|nr:ABC transporter permease [Bacillaceae bacterium]
MIPYLSLLLKLVFTNKWKLLFSVITPFIVLFLMVPVISSAFEKSVIPIAWIDEDGSDYSAIIRGRVDEYERLKIVDMTRSEAFRAIQKGELEGGFVIRNGFQKQVKQGNIAETIEWLRSEGSVFDTFAKENVASEVMRLAVNSQAANEVQRLKEEEDSQNWNHYFEHADSYWEPEPLFQMNFQTYHIEKSKSSRVIPLSLMGITSFGFWYAWVLASIALLPVFQMRKNDILSRLSIVSGNLSRLYLVLFLGTVVLAIGLWGIWLLVLVWLFDVLNTEFFTMGIQSVWALMGAILLTYMSMFIFRERNGYVLFIIVFSLVSFSVSSLYLVSGGTGWWYYLMPHTWLYEIMYR